MGIHWAGKGRENQQYRKKNEQQEGDTGPILWELHPRYWEQHPGWKLSPTIRLK